MRIKLKGKKPTKIKNLIFKMLDVLNKIGIAMDNLTDRRKERMAEACMAVSGIISDFSEAKEKPIDGFLRSRDIIDFMNKNYAEAISSGSYDDIRRKDLAQLVDAGIVLNSSSLNAKSTNNPTRGYSISKEFALLLHSYKTSDWENALVEFKVSIKNRKEELAHKREIEKVPVLLPSGERLMLSYGEHNELQKRIVEEFLPRFGMKSKILYLGDTSDKDLFRDNKTLNKLNFFKLEHEELPDIIAYSEEKELLFLIEAVHSAGPMSELRVRKLKDRLKDCQVGIIFVTAFETRETFKKWITDIAWETEVWIAESPDHMIHFNGYKFLKIHE